MITLGEPISWGSLDSDEDALLRLEQIARRKSHLQLSFGLALINVTPIWHPLHWLLQVLGWRPRLEQRFATSAYRELEKDELPESCSPPFYPKPTTSRDLVSTLWHPVLKRELEPRPDGPTFFHEAWRIVLVHPHFDIIFATSWRTRRIIIARRGADQ